MNYEKIIIKLLGRIKVLEEKIDYLMENKEIKEEHETVSTQDICNYIINLKKDAKSKGKEKIVLIARDIHGELNLKSRYPMVCNAMRYCMDENDTIIFQPPKGNSSTLEIEYEL